MTDPDVPAEPIRVQEVMVAAYRWDAWRSAAEATSRRSRRTAGVLAVVVGVAVGVTGLLLLPSEARISVAVYAPFVGWSVWKLTQAFATARGLRSSVAELRNVLVPSLVDVATDDSLESLLLNGGTLVVERSTVVVAEARDSLVALVASEYDAEALPPAIGGTFSGGP